MCSRGIWSFQSLYLTRELNFTPENTVRLNEIGGAGGLFVQVCLTPWIIYRVGEKWTVVIGLSVFVFYCFAYATNFVDTAEVAYVMSLVQDVSNVNCKYIVNPACVIPECL